MEMSHTNFFGIWTNSNLKFENLIQNLTEKLSIQKPCKNIAFGMTFSSLS